jgi:hypothetical protein
MIWDPKTKLVSPQFHDMFGDNFDTVQAPDPNVKITDTMDHLFKTNKYKYDDPFGNDHTYLFIHGGVDIHPDIFSPNLETCQESMTITFTYDDKDSKTPNNPSNENTQNNKSIFPQNSKDYFKEYKHLHGIDMQIHSIPKPPKQKAQNMGLSDIHEEESKIFAMEYNATNNEPGNKLDHYVNTLQRSN